MLASALAMYEFSSFFDFYIDFFGDFGSEKDDVIPFDLKERFLIRFDLVEFEFIW